MKHSKDVANGMPEGLVIAGEVWQVRTLVAEDMAKLPGVELNDEGEPDIAGRTNPSDMTITVWSGLPPHAFRVVLLHEVMHAALNHMPDTGSFTITDPEEWAVSSLDYPLFAAFSANPALVSFLFSNWCVVRPTDGA